MDLRQHCGSSRRRQLVADAQIDMGGGILLNGIDFVEVLDRDAPSEELRQRLIDVTFIRPDGAVSAGGPLLARRTSGSAAARRVTGIVVEEVAKGPGNRTLRLTVDRAGDFSIYELSLHAGAAADEPPANMDRRARAGRAHLQGRLPDELRLQGPAGRHGCPGARASAQLSGQGLRQLPPADARPDGDDHPGLGRPQPG